MGGDEILPRMGARRAINGQRTRRKRCKTAGNVRPTAAPDLSQMDPNPQCEGKLIVAILMNHISHEEMRGWGTYHRGLLTSSVGHRDE